MRSCGGQVLSLLLVVCFVLCHPSDGQTSCPQRVRKPWGVMTQAERNLYVEALGVGMQKGYHILFTEVASEKTSSTEFLRTCGFLYWNRRFVLAYENMLRSLGSKYACLTIPYWDYFADYARFVEKKCENNGTSIEACSPILRGLGGSQGTARSVTINGRTIAGNCVTKAPANSFCESSTITTSSQCARCIPRANWAEKTFPASFGYAGLGVALGDAGGFRDVTQNIQTGTHNAIHSALSSVLASYVSPADPVFFSIQYVHKSLISLLSASNRCSFCYLSSATVDLLAQIYLECQLGDNVLPTDKDVSRWVFQQCVYKDEVSPKATSNVTQLWMVDGSYPTSKAAIRAEDHPKLSRFFKPLPSKYWEFVNINKLGTNSYQYNRDDLLQNMQRYGFTCPKRGTSLPTALSSTAMATATINMEDSPAESSVSSSGADISGLDVTRDLQEFQSYRQLTETFESEQEERAYVQEQAIDLLETTLAEALDVDGTAKTAFTQAELIECQYHYETVGMVEDYSSVFRFNYGISPYEHPRCWDLVNQMQAGHTEILVDNWRDIFDDHFNSSTNNLTDASTSMPS